METPNTIKIKGLKFSIEIEEIEIIDINNNRLNEVSDHFNILESHVLEFVTFMKDLKEISDKMKKERNEDKT